jgi:putative tryptophan/tyrosine transport system substrate-binding protein
VDVIVAPTSAYAEAARQATSTVPIVFVTHGDPRGAGHVASLVYPGGNMTGLAQMETEVSAKGLELLKEAVPTVTRVAVLWEPAILASIPALKAVDARARALALRLQPLALRRPDELDTLFSVMPRADALLALSGSVAFTERQRLADLLIERRLPSMFTQKEQVEAGGLLSYGANLADLFRRAATYVDKILKGAKPSDLPVEQPTRFELVINMRTAKALGLTIPPSILVRANELIQ